jgi:tetratricopeptide (TPR) repeat protein
MNLLAMLMPNALEHSNILVVGFDRDYNYEIVSHRLDRGRFNIVDVTEISDRDIQQIYSKIPTEIRVDRLLRPPLEGGNSPSLFEIVESNSIGPSLYKRFTSVLSRLQNEAELLHDISVTAMYTCRVPVSYDTVFAFLRGNISSYEDVFNLIDQLGSMVTDYRGPLIEEEQDYYVSRSALLSEAIINQVSPEGFKRAFLRFHEKVSPWRICRFDVFRRKAFDEQFARKAFPDWKEGMEFYSNLFSKDGSPYLYKVRCLLHRGRHREAFNWIDRAIVLSGNRIPSIRNSHAIILFRTNIGIQDPDGTVKQTLRQSMDILAECYSYDRRKIYHAVSFAEQAVKYYDRYLDQVGKGYLETAASWLKEEIIQSPWNRDVRRLTKLINKKFQQV